jgi:hypothetical protein
MMNLPKPHLFGVLAGLFLAAGLVLSSMLGTATWLKVKNSQFISVKGSARKDVQADLAIWRGAFIEEAPTILEAQKALQTDSKAVEVFLQEEGATNFVLLPITIEERHGTLETNSLTREMIVGYRLTQPVRVESTDVALIRRLNLESSGLVEGGILFTSAPPQFIYTRSAETKIEMLAEATKDARARAEQIAGQGARTIAQLHSAEMGVFQITPRYDFETTWEGVNDMSSPDKTITAVVTATFALK